MKNWTSQTCSLALALALLPLLAGCDQEQANSAPVTSAEVAQAPADTTTSLDASLSDTNPPAPEVMEDKLASAPGTIISTPSTAAASGSNNPQLNEVVKLVQAGVGEAVLMAYVTNSASPFNVSSDDVIYLNDIGVPENVVTAMLQRDQYFTAAAAAAANQPPDTNMAPGGPGAAPSMDENVATQVPEMDNTPPLTPPESVVEQVEQSPNGSYSYFYDSLAPYGNWVDIEGYGPCWQPTVVVANHTWQPYCDRGHWVYSDCGWCWVSDYSWGWAPFHYGRWFRHGRFGWCWAPDTVWGPAWVSWRYTDTHCGWAALPPTACYRPGYGFTYFGHSVGFNFTFGLNSSCFLFVPLDRCHDRNPWRYRVPHREVTKIYSAAVVNNTIIRGNNNTVINRGVPVDKVAAASHTQIRPIHIRADADAPRSAELGRDGRSLAVYRPALPTPKPLGKSPGLVGEGVKKDTHFDLPSRINRQQSVTAGRNNLQPNPVVTSVNPIPGNPATPGRPDHRPIISNPVPGNGQRQLQDLSRNNNNNRFPQQPDTQKPTAPIWRSTPGQYQAPAQAESSTPRRSPVFQPNQPERNSGQQNQGDNNRGGGHRFDQQQQEQPAQPQNPPATVFNHPNNPNNNPGRTMPQQPQWQQRQLQHEQQQDAAPVYRAPERPNRDYNPVFRTEPVAPPRVMESHSAPETFSSRSYQPPVQQTAPPQYSAPQSGGGGGNHGGGNGGGAGGGGGGGGGNHGGGGGNGGGGGGGNNNNNNNNNNNQGGGGVGGRGR